MHCWLCEASPFPHFSHACCYCSVAKSCLTLCNPMVYSPPGSFVHGISQARILEWVTISFSWGSSWSRDQTHVSCIGRWILYRWAIYTHTIKHGNSSKQDRFGWPSYCLAEDWWKWRRKISGEKNKGKRSCFISRLCVSWEQECLIPIVAVYPVSVTGCCCCFCLPTLKKPSRQFYPNPWCS